MCVYAQTTSHTSRRRVTFERVQSFAGADGGQWLVVVVEFLVIRHGGGDGVGVGVGVDVDVDVGFDLSFCILLLCVAAIRAAQGPTHTLNIQ